MAAAAVLCGCGAQEPEPTVTVFAAASLKESFTALGEEFEERHPGTEVEFSFGGSDTLAAGITGGAPADVFASADGTTMARVTRAGGASGRPKVFARNRLQIVTLPGNPHRIRSLGDLDRPELKVVLCDASVPCGAAARKALDTARLRLSPASYEQDVKSALTKVRLKEADAALVYATDVRAAGDAVAGVEFPEADTALNSYPITVLADAPQPERAAEFVAFVRSAEGRRVLREAGFLEPGPEAP
ncbi:molybdate ABC transporter substrate-binding protein [Streptomyces abyssomicinicus]|uniref:molybdate ABC transporter substrate-binding protein n=1 Tax=Streptomyces abyssomicinicus TaxID=574929 RepID=UPI001FE7962B|nr:molybdate ABC transporter substrate-binding protein [Streptomyces abyssomicinicus]